MIRYIPAWLLASAAIYAIIHAGLFSSWPEAGMYLLLFLLGIFTTLAVIFAALGETQGVKLPW